MLLNAKYVPAGLMGLWKRVHNVVMADEQKVLGLKSTVP